MSNWTSGVNRNTKLIITRGLPGSGKTTKAKAWVEEDRAHRIRVNRDDIRGMFDDGRFVKGVTEPRVIMARDALIIRGLQKGLDVVCDDTNLPQRTARDLAKLATICKAEFEVWDLTDVNIQICIDRDSARRIDMGEGKEPVGEDVIREHWRKFIHGKPFPLPMPEETEEVLDSREYTPDESLPKAVIVDIDGTLALHGARSPFDETRVHEDRPNPFPIMVAKSLWEHGYTLVIMSGRTRGCYEDTVEWLENNLGVPFKGPFMREIGDGRKDMVAKLELFNEHVRNNYNVVGTLDDRDQVVKMWREVLGITCMQVAPGNF
jgi:predicted kinase